MRSKLNKFLYCLQVEKGFSQGTTEAYQLDIEKGLIPFLHQRAKFAVGDVTKADIRDYLDYVATSIISDIFNKYGLWHSPLQWKAQAHFHAW